MWLLSCKVHIGTASALAPKPRVDTIMPVSPSALQIQRDVTATPTLPSAGIDKHGTLAVKATCTHAQHKHSTLAL